MMRLGVSQSKGIVLLFTCAEVVTVCWQAHSGHSITPLQGQAVLLSAILAGLLLKNVACAPPTALSPNASARPDIPPAEEFACLPAASMDAAPLDDKQRLHLMVNGVVDYAIILLDPDGRVIGWNAGAEQIKGYPSHDILGQHFSRFFTEPDIESGGPELILQTAAATGRYRGEGWRVREDGSLFWANVVVTALRGEDGILRGYTQVTRDSTEHKMTETALRTSETRLNAIINAVPLGIFVADAAGRCQYINNVCHALFGMVTGHDLAEGLGQSVPEEDREETLAYWQRCLENQVSYQHEHRCLCPDGQILWVSVQATAIVDQGALLGYVGTIEDVTFRKQTEIQVEQHLLQIQEYSAQLEYQKSELEHANARLENLATTDGLTGLKNHRAFQERLENEFQRARRYNTPLSLVLLDVDQFKQYNDVFGHQAGDDVLKTVAATLRATARQTDFLARYGGEEFVAILPNTDPAQAACMAERLRAAIAGVGWTRREVTASFGIATLTPATPDRTGLITEADAALYAAKQTGRNRVLHFQDMRQSAAPAFLAAMN